jgi:phage-related protein
VKTVFGFALHMAQVGDKHPDAKPLTGLSEFRGAGVMEVVDDFDGDTYRCIYTVKFKGVVYALDIFQKKSKTGRSTPKKDIDRIKARLQWARRHYEENYAKQEAR